MTDPVPEILDESELEAVVGGVQKARRTVKKSPKLKSPSAKGAAMAKPGRPAKFDKTKSAKTDGSAAHTKDKSKFI